ARRDQHLQAVGLTRNVEIALHDDHHLGRRRRIAGAAGNHSQRRAHQNDPGPHDGSSLLSSLPAGARRTMRAITCAFDDPPPPPRHQPADIIRWSPSRAELGRGRRLRRADALLAERDVESAVRALPGDELYYVLHELGLHDAAPTLTAATAEQLQVVLDFA